MEHALDNPVWNALTSGNKHLAQGNQFVKYFDREVSPFAGLKTNSADNFSSLYDIIPHAATTLVTSLCEIDIPRPWKVVRGIQGIQMVCNNAAEQVNINAEMVSLTTADVPQMLELTKLTHPGPFDPRTIEFGHYKGVFESDSLVAMAGQRLHAFNYAEVSAVCTHPDHTGKGYARQLMQYQVDRIRASREIPYLHVRYDNDRAIKVYESLGFSKRVDIYFYVIQKA
jgi:predicted GNAT family acetyltransferase